MPLAMVMQVTSLVTLVAHMVHTLGHLRTFNFTLTITVTTVTAGTYNALFTTAADTREVPDVFVTPPGMLAFRSYK